MNWFLQVKLEQGLQVLKIYKDHTSKQCILDDFDFYEDRQKKIQEKKAKQQHFQKQVVGIIISEYLHGTSLWVFHLHWYNINNRSLPAIVYRLKFGKANQLKRRTRKARKTQVLILSLTSLQKWPLIYARKLHQLFWLMGIARSQKTTLFQNLEIFWRLWNLLVSQRRKM